MKKHYLIIGKKKINITKLLKEQYAVYGLDGAELIDNTVRDIVFHMRYGWKEGSDWSSSTVFTKACNNEFYFNKNIDKKN